MAEGWFQVALSNQAYFSNTTSNDLIIRTGTAAQNIHLGPLSGTAPSQMRINQSGVLISNTLNVGSHIIPTANETFDLGTSNLRFRDLYLSGATINIGGTTISRNSAGSVIVGSDTNQPTRLIVNEIVVTDATTSSNAVVIRTDATTGDVSIVKSTVDQVMSSSNVTPSNTNTATPSTDTFVKNIYNSNNFIGIGTSNPQSELHVIGTVRSTTGYMVDGNTVVSAARAISGASLNVSGDVTCTNVNFTGNLLQNGVPFTSGGGGGGGSLSGLTTNKLAVASSACNIYTPTNLHWDAVNNALGVNISNPSGSLHVAGTINATGLNVAGPMTTTSTSMVGNLTAENLGVAGQNAAFFRNATNINAGTLGVAFGGTGAASLTNSKVLVGAGTSAVTAPVNLHWDSAANTGAGALGVGVTNPSGHLHVGGNTNVQGALNVTGTVAANALTVATNTLVTNLNADRLDNQEGSFYLDLANATGSLTVARGGTGATALTSNKIVVGNGTSAVSTPTNLHWDQTLNSGNGALGVGVTNPSGHLHVGGNTNVQGNINATGTVVANAITVTSTALVANLNADRLDSQEGTYYLDLANATGTLDVAKGGTGVTSLTSNKLVVGNGTTGVNTPTNLHWDQSLNAGAGALAIGHANPSGHLHVVGNTNLQGNVNVTGTMAANALTVSTTGVVTNLTSEFLGAASQDAAFFRNATNINAGTLGVSFGGTGATSLTANRLLVGSGTSAVSAVNNLMWDGSNLGVGAVTTPSGTLHVVGDIFFTGNLIQNGSPFASISGLTTGSVPFATSSTTIGNSVMHFATSCNFIGINQTSPTAPLHVSSSNAQGVGILADGDIAAFSDSRLKTNLTVIPDALEKVAKVSGYTYDRVGSVGGKRLAGVVAQEMMEVLPEVVSRAEDGYYSVSYGNISALLINAIKELKTRVENLEAKVA